MKEYIKAKIKADQYKQLLVCPDGIFDKQAWKQKRTNQKKEKSQLVWKICVPI